MKYKTVVPPKVVMQTSPGQRIFRVVLLVAAFVLAIWLSYDYGRTHAPTNGQGAVALDPASGERIAALEQERDTLKQQVAKLKQDVQASRQALEAARVGVRMREQANSAPPEAPQADAGPADTAPADATPSDEAPADEAPAASAPEMDKRLTLGDVRIEPTESGNRFRYRFSVAYPGDTTKRIVGTIWIAVNGLSHGDPTRLSLKAISAERRAFVKMSLQGQQTVEGEITLPPDFSPKNMVIEAKPYDERYQGASGKFDWAAGG
jgi:cell division protein FtsB